MVDSFKCDIAYGRANVAATLKVLQYELEQCKLDNPNRLFSIFYPGTGIDKCWEEEYLEGVIDELQNQQSEAIPTIEEFACNSGQILRSEITFRIDGSVSPKADSDEDPVSTTGAEEKQQDDPTEGISKIFWKGSKTDLGRVFEILKELLGCSATEWERHFFGPDGKEMKGAVDSADNLNSKSGAIQALCVAGKNYAVQESGIQNSKIVKKS